MSSSNTSISPPESHSTPPESTSNSGHGTPPGKQDLRKTLVLALGAMGVVYGDIGTSPLYTVKECFHGMHAVALTTTNILGVMSLIFWSMTVVVTIKYVMFILRADNEGEGGIYALVALFLGQGSKLVSEGTVKRLAFLAIFGAALLYGDGGRPWNLAALHDRVYLLTRLHRVRGHRIAQVDPLGLPRPIPPALTPEFFGITEADMDQPVYSETFQYDGPLTLGKLLERLRNTYCRSIGVQYMHIDDLQVRRWLQRRMETTQNRLQLTREEQLRIFTRLTDAVTFEEAIVLYADLAQSTKLVNGHKNWFAADVYKSYLHCASKIIKDQGIAAALPPGVDGSPRPRSAPARQRRSRGSADE